MRKGLGSAAGIGSISLSLRFRGCGFNRPGGENMGFGAQKEPCPNGIPLECSDWMLPSGAGSGPEKTWRAAPDLGIGFRAHGLGFLLVSGGQT